MIAPIVIARFRHIPRPEANAALISITASILLLLLKLIAYYFTASAAVRHLLRDAVTSVAVLVALSLIKLTGWTWIDPVAALLVAAYLIYIASGLLGHSAAGLMDTQDASDEAMLRKILDAHASPGGP